MIVNNKGYLKLKDVELLEYFSIYETHKKTNILVLNTSKDNIQLYLPDSSRLEWKLTEGKHIISGKKIFDSKINNIQDIDLSRWNNKTQIMVYEPF